MTKKYTSPEHAIRNILESKKDFSVFGDVLTDIAGAAGTLLKTKPKVDLKLPDEAPTGNLPAVRPAEPTPSAPAAEVPAVRASEPEAATAPAVRTNQPAPAEAPRVRTDADTSTSVKTDTETVPSAKTDTNVRTDTKTQTNLKTSPKAKTSTKTKVATAVGLGAAGGMLGSMLGGSGGSPRGGGAGITPGQPIGVGAGGTFDVPSFLHMATDRRVFEENDADKARRKIVSVPRPDSKREETMTRNQEIKQKVVEETAKKKAIIKDAVKEYSVKMNPEYKNEKLDERALRWGATGAGVGAGVAASDPISKTLQDSGLQSGKQLSGTETALDLGLDAASMIPGYGAIPSLINAGRRFSRGDYLDAGLDVLSAIPFVGTVIKGGKMIRGGLKAADALGTVGNAVQTGVGVAPLATDMKDAFQKGMEGTPPEDPNKPKKSNQTTIPTS